METRHIKLTYEEALNAKKLILSSELSTIYILKRIKAYQMYRKLEIATKNKLKAYFSSLRSRIDLSAADFPKEKIPHLAKPKPISAVKNRVDENLQKELEEIKRKLERLG